MYALLNNITYVFVVVVENMYYIAKVNFIYVYVEINEPSIRHKMYAKLLLIYAVVIFIWGLKDVRYIIVNI